MAAPHAHPSEPVSGLPPLARLPGGAPVPSATPDPDRAARLAAKAAREARLVEKEARLAAKAAKQAAPKLAAVASEEVATPSQNAARAFVGAAYRMLLGRAPGAEAPIMARLMVESRDGAASVLRKIVAGDEFFARCARLADPTAYRMQDDPALAKFLTPEIVARNASLETGAAFDRRGFEAFATSAASPDQSTSHALYFDYHSERFRELLNAAIWALDGKGNPALLEVGGSVFSLILRQRFPDAAIDLLDKRPAEWLEPVRRHMLQIDLEGFPDALPPLEGPPYDVVFFSEVLEHLLAHPARVLRFLLGLLRPGGVLIVTTPNIFRADNLRSIAARQNPLGVHPKTPNGERRTSHHIREYAMSELLNFAVEAGGEIVAWRFSGCWDEPEAVARLPADQLRNLFVMVRRPAAG